MHAQTTRLIPDTVSIQTAKHSAAEADSRRIAPRLGCRRRFGDAARARLRAIRAVYGQESTATGHEGGGVAKLQGRR